MRILRLGEEPLRGISVPVEKIDEEITALADEMFAAMKRSDGIGLAAPQVGKNIRLFIVQIGKNEGMVFINPQIIATSEKLCTMEEGCLSIPGVFEEVVRPEAVTVQYTGMDGRKKIIEASGLLARVIQHENDHLDGVLFIDRIDGQIKERVERKFENKKKLTLRSFK